MADAKYAVESKSVELLLGPDSVSFRVPEFQRRYAWGAEEVIQLLDDLYYDTFWLGDTSSREVPYFLGSIVLAQKDGMCLILDGQQRLITISLILIILRAELEKLGFEDAVQIRKYLQSGKIGQKKAPKLKLQPGDAELYEKTLRSLEHYQQSGYQRFTLAHAMKRIHTRLNEYVTHACQTKYRKPVDVLAKMLDILLYGVEFVTITSPSESDAFKLFETLNDRGLALNAADLIKNKLFAQCAKDKALLDDAIEAWTNMIELIGDREIVNFLRYFWIASEGFVRKRALYDVFRKKLETLGATEAVQFAFELQKYATLYQHIASPNPKTCPWGEDVAEALQRLVNYKARSYRPALLACAVERSNDMAQLVTACESITIRHSIVGERNPNQLEKIYADLCVALRKDKSRPVQEILMDTGFDIPDDGEFEKSFAKIDLTSVTTAWREILVRLNSLLSTGETRVEGTTKVHVEHILPRKPGAKTLQEANLKPQEADELIGRIGNLTLLSGKINREISNKPFSIKRKRYESSEIALTRSIAKEERWGREEIEKRSRELAKLAIEAYPWPISKDRN